MTRRVAWIVLVAVACVQAGCTSLRKRAELHFAPQCAITNWSRAPRFERLGIRRVAVVPFVDRSRYAEASKRLTEAFALELRKTRKFDVLTLERGEPLARLAASRARFDAVEARMLGETLNVDALVLGEIVEYEPYRPIAIGLRVVMIDTRSGRVVWSVDETLDTGELAVANLARQYYYDVVDPAASQFLDDRVLLSMRSFARCVCYHFVRTLDRPLSAGAEAPASARSGAASGDS
jgi:TolB-like protein